MSVAEQDFYTLLTPEHCLVRLLDTGAAGVIATGVVGVGLHVRRAHLPQVAQEKGPVGVGILADGAVLDIEAGVLVELLLEHARLLRRELREKDLRGVAGVAGVAAAVFDLGHAAAEVVERDAGDAAEVERVQVLDLTHDDCYVVGRLVIDDHAALAVVDDAAGGVDGALEEGVAVRPRLVVALQDL